MSSNTSVQVAVAHAVSFLTRPLTATYPAATIAKLQLMLEANLTSFYSPSWQPKNAQSGCSQRALLLSPASLPPRAIYAACVSAGVQWFDWMHMLGDQEFTLFVDPGRIGVQQAFGDVHPVTIWSASSGSMSTAGRMPQLESIQAAIQRRHEARQKTFAQEILEHDDEEDEQLFSLLNQEMKAPQWMTPVTARFPASALRSPSPLSSISSGSTISSFSAHSRSSSFSSTTSSTGYSYDSSTSSSAMAKPTQQRKTNKTRATRVYVDTTRNEVTPYDGGKTTVLTGGVMLGSRK